jgi:hypothetical protein
MQYTNDAISNAFRTLVQIVNDFQLNGKVCLGATLKPKLRERGIDENALGYQKFGEFLRAAEAAGHVTLTRSLAGVDIAISLVPLNPTRAVSPGQQSMPMPTPKAIPLVTGGPIKVRPDLWTAFNSFFEGWIYDSVRDVAFKDQQGPLAPGVVRIPSGRERVTEWMRSFAEMQDADTKTHLLSIATGSPSLYEFNRATRFRGILREWSRFHVQNVLAAIDAWATSNRVRPANIAIPFSADPPKFTPRPVIPAQSTKYPSVPEVSPPSVQPSPFLSNRLASLVDSLITDLISLRGLLQISGPQS